MNVRTPAWLVGPLIGGGAAVFAMFMLERVDRAAIDRLRADASPETAVVLLGALVLAILIHELGHLIAAVVVEWRPIGLYVGPLYADVPARRLRFNARWSLWGGAARSRPAEWRGCARFRREAMCMVAGGPLSSALAALLCAMLYSSIAVSPLSQVAGSTALLSAIIACATLVPVALVAGDSDGRALVRLHRATDAELLPMAAAVLAQQDSPDHWPEALKRLLTDTAALPIGRVLGPLHDAWHALSNGASGVADLALRRAEQGALALADDVERERWLQLVTAERSVLHLTWMADSPMVHTTQTYRSSDPLLDELTDVTSALDVGDVRTAHIHLRRAHAARFAGLARLGGDRHRATWERLNARLHHEAPDRLHGNGLAHSPGTL